MFQLGFLRFFFRLSTVVFEWACFASSDCRYSVTIIVGFELSHGWRMNTITIANDRLDLEGVVCAIMAPKFIDEQYEIFVKSQFMQSIF